jgi:HSP20 family protein
MALTKWKNDGRNVQDNNANTRSSLLDSPLKNFLGIPSFFNSSLTKDFMEDLFDNSLGNNFNNIGRTLPAVNISETDNDLVIEVAAPGMQKKDFKVEVNNNQLSIRYNKELKDEKRQENSWRKEFSFESFERTIALPAMAESDNISATYLDGILKLTVPKKEEARRKPAKSIEVK